ncbi:hypothetical protein K2X05_09990 [bacterium]|nr:hypothetical protein [bacterium]
MKKITVSITEFYLSLLSFFYIVIGICVIFPIQSLKDTAENLALMGFMAGFIPDLFITSLVSILPGEFNPLIIFLGVLALTLGILGLISLFRMRKNPKWIRLWYFISILLIIIGVSNAFFVAVYSLIFPIATYFAVKNLRKLTLQTTANDTALHN